MGFTLEEIKVLEKPFEALGNADALAQNRVELNKLNDAEKKHLATRLVLECPDEEFAPFFHAIEACRVPQDDGNSFHEVLTSAYEVKKRITSLLDPRNNHPHTYLLEEEFDEDLFNNFNNLALNVLNGKEIAIAQRLALTTPQENRNNLTLNIRNMFPNSAFLTELSTAFAIRRDVDRLLLCEHPESFFTSPEFNIDNCLKFAGLFPSLLKGHEQAIGEKLATLDSAARSDIGRRLEELNHAAHDQANPFRLIAAAMNPKQQQAHVPLKSSQDGDDEEDDVIFQGVLEVEEVSSSSPSSSAGAGNHPSSLFAPPELKRRALMQGNADHTTVNVKDTANDAGNDSDDEKQKSGRCCGLW